MNRKISIKVIDKLIISAHELENEGRMPFTAEDLVVMAWKKYPDTFGLRGYIDQNGNLIYPDSNRVFAEIMGSKPIRKRGYIKKVGQKLYQLTEAGRAEAERISKVQVASPIRKITLARDTLNVLQKLLDSKVNLKFLSNDIENINFFDACAFWNISPRSTAIDFIGKAANIDKIIEIAKEAVGDGEASFTHRGKMIEFSDLEKLTELQLFLRKKFESEINIIMERTDERK